MKSLRGTRVTIYFFKIINYHFAELWNKRLTPIARTNKSHKVKQCHIRYHYPLPYMTNFLRKYKFCCLLQIRLSHTTSLKIPVRTITHTTWLSTLHYHRPAPKGEEMWTQRHVLCSFLRTLRTTLVRNHYPIKNLSPIESPDITISPKRWWLEVQDQKHCSWFKCINSLVQPT